MLSAGWMVWGLLGCAGMRAAQRGVVVQPDDPAAWVTLGDAYKRRLKKRRAQEAYSRALSLDPQSAEASAGLASTQGRAGSNRVVRQALRNPTDDELWGDAGDYYFSIGRRDEALSAYTYALELDPTDSEWQRAIFNLAGADRLLEIMDARGDSIGDEGLGDLGDVLRDVGRTEEACVAYRRANAIDPSDDEWINRVAECDGTVPSLTPEVLGGQLGGIGIAGTLSEGVSIGGADAVSVLRSRVFSNAELLRELGMAHAQAGELDQARDYLHSSLLLKPSDDATIELFVAVTGRTRRAVLEQLVEEVPDNDELLGELGDQMLSEGRPQEALVYYRRALELDDDDPEWTRKVALMESITGRR